MVRPGLTHIANFATMVRDVALGNVSVVDPTESKPGLYSGYISESALSQLHNNFLAQFPWLLVQPIRIVLLNANGTSPWGLPF